MPNYVYRGEETRNPNTELTHYGRLGMKWGKHIFGTSKTYAKASRHLDKLNASADEKKKAAREADKDYRNVSFWGANRPEARIAAMKASGKAQKAQKAQEKADKFEGQMADVFKNTKVSDLSKDARSAGQKYLYVFKKDYAERAPLAKERNRLLYETELEEKSSRRLANNDSKTADALEKEGPSGDTFTRLKESDIGDEFKGDLNSQHRQWVDLYRATATGYNKDADQWAKRGKELRDIDIANDSKKTIKKKLKQYDTKNRNSMYSVKLR